MKSFILPPPLTFCHIFSISYFLKYIRVPTLFQKNRMQQYVYHITTCTGEQLAEIHYDVALHCMIPNCQRQFVLQNAP